tara:strand:- start:43 stop:306 length:264 start_codon:yes stop_codon:yes gene_type:complete
MITKENLTEVLNQLTKEDINEAMNSKSDYLALYMNGYGYVFLESFDINNEEKEEEILSTGGIIIDKDNLLQLFKESESINPFLIELI